MANYSRKCRDCERWINLRLMPHGRYVAFEGDEPHKCSKEPARKAGRTGRPEPSVPVGRTAEEDNYFTPLYPKVAEPIGPSPSPIDKRGPIARNLNPTPRLPSTPSRQPSISKVPDQSPPVY